MRLTSSPVGIATEGSSEPSTLAAPIFSFCSSSGLASPDDVATTPASVGLRRRQ
jgi:hypothetical protein